MLHPLVLLVVLIAVIFVLFGNRKVILAPLIFIFILIPMQQRVVIAGIDFMVLRIMLMFCWIRVIYRFEYKHIKLNTIDKVVILWVFANVINYTLLWKTQGAFVNRLGFAYNVLGIYFLFRILINDIDDIKRLIRVFVIIAVVVAICMFVEQVTRRNIFAVFGGVPEITSLREGRLRSQAAFGHPILAGIFGATLMPLFASLWWQKLNKKFALMGSIAAIVICMTSSSSTPVLAFLGGVVGLSMWHLRKHMNVIRWGIIFGIISLHLVMNAPVWALINRVGLVSGSTAYHRFYLLDQFIKRFDEWWLLGTKSTVHWGSFMNDYANQYVIEGVRGGFLTLLLFIAVIGYCFRGIGRSLNIVKFNSNNQFLLWSLGASLFAHVVGFMGISYWDQIIVLWYSLLAMISTSYSVYVNSDITYQN